MQLAALPRLNAATHPTVDFATQADDAAICRAQSPPTSLSNEAPVAKSFPATLKRNEGETSPPTLTFPQEALSGPVFPSISKMESTMRFQEADERTFVAAAWSDADNPVVRAEYAVDIPTSVTKNTPAQKAERFAIATNSDAMAEEG